MQHMTALQPFTAAAAPPSPARRATAEGPAPDPSPAIADTLPNPALRLDPALGLVVLEFRDSRGQARTIPSERQLAAYREAALPRGGPGDPAASGSPAPAGPRSP